MDEAIVRIIKETCKHYKLCTQCGVQCICSRLFPTITPCDVDVEDLLKKLKES